MNFAGARVLVTGATSGIGAELVRVLRARGATVLPTGRNAEALDGGFPADLCEPGAAAAVAEWAGHVDAFLGNAGIGYAGEFAGMPEDRIAPLVTVNQTVNMELARLLLPGMLERGRGAVGFVTSIAGVMAVADEAVYSATKAGLCTFADSLRLAAAPRGVGVTTIVPGVVQTPFFERRGTPYDRARPRPVSPRRVALATVRGMERGRAEVFVPAWLRFPARLHGAMPGVVRALRTRFE